MGPIQGYFATTGPGAVAGIAAGYVIFTEFAATVPNCGALDPSDCTQLLGMTGVGFVGLVAAVGGLAGFCYQIGKGEIG